jgi:hypothetical protein
MSSLKIELEIDGDLRSQLDNAYWRVGRLSEAVDRGDVADARHFGRLVSNKLEEVIEELGRAAWVAFSRQSRLQIEIEQARARVIANHSSHAAET